MASSVLVAHEVDARRARRGVRGEVVRRGAEAAGGDHQPVGAREAGVTAATMRSTSSGTALDRADREARGGELGSEPRGVGVDDLAPGELGPDREKRDGHDEGL